MLWINVGCGPHLAPEPWVNIDGNNEDFELGDSGVLERRPNVKAWSDALPYADGTVDRIYAGHVLEHIPLYDGSVDRTLAEFKRVLKPGAPIMCTGPDMTKCAEMVYAGALDWRMFWQAHGTSGRGNPGTEPHVNPRPGDVHQWNSTEEAVWVLMAKYWSRLRVMQPWEADTSWPIVARVPWQYTIVAL